MRSSWAIALVLLVFGGLSLSIPRDTRSEDASTISNAERVRAAFERWATGGGFFDQLLAADVSWTIHGSGPLAKTYAGRDAFIREAVRPFAARLVKPVTPTIRHLVARGDVVVAVWDGEAMARDGVPYKNNYVWVFRIQDGKAVEVEAFLDLEPYYAVLKRVPLPESR